MTDKRLNYWIPKWMSDVINRRVCSKCKKKARSIDVIAIGIRELNTGKSCLYSEHQCSKCSHRSLTLFDKNDKRKTGTLQEMCFTLLESIKNKKRIETARQLTEKMQNDMSDQNVNKFLKFLRNVPTHDEFLRHIGSTLDCGFLNDYEDTD